MFSKFRKILKDKARTTRLIVNWNRAKRQVTRRPASTTLSRVLVLPASPQTVVGSKGDEAMMFAIISQLKTFSPNVEIDFITPVEHPHLPEMLRAAGAHEAVPIWKPSFRFTAFLEIIDGYDAFLIVGADVLDGYYSKFKSMFYFMLADIAARSGATSVIIGFSFNSRPKKVLQSVIRRVSPKVSFFSRDEGSLIRFREASQGRGELTADCAFLLLPERDSGALAPLLHWVRERRDDGDALLGFNIHPLLLLADHEGQAKLVEGAVQALSRLLAERKVSIALISHDYRSTNGDLRLLSPIHDRMKAQFPDRLYLAEHEFTAGELKALSGEMDALFTGRMHLSIAALGMGVPVGWATYQGKFAGLAKHFSLPDWLLLTPQEVQDPEKLHATLARLLDERQPLTEQVRNTLPQVKALARKNFAPFD